MAIKGFNVGGSVNRYDFDSLENVTGAAAYDVANNLTTASAGQSVLDAAQGKVLGDRLASIGSVTTGTISLTECASSAWATEGSITLTKGYYIVFFGNTWPTTPVTGKRHSLVVSSSSGTSAVVAQAAQRTSAVGVSNAASTSSAYGSFGYNVSASSQTLYLRVWQNSGSAITPTEGSLYAVRIA